MDNHSGLDKPILSNAPAIERRKSYHNNAPPKNYFLFKLRNKVWSDMPDREIYPLVHDNSLPNNRVQTSKYTWLTFLPINLYEQFTQLANVYFLVIAFLQTIPSITITGGHPVMVLPLTIILTVSGLKSLFEDYKRHKSDREENNRKVLVMRNGNFINECWKNVKVGDIVKVNRNEMLPADLILLHSSDPKGKCYVETKNLDGETNLKLKYAHKDISKHFSHYDRMLDSTNLLFSYDKPNPYLYAFKGTMTSNEAKVPLDYNSFLLRGCSLKNTDYVYGLICYSGHETKIMLNSVKAQPKKSTVERAMSNQVLLIFIVQNILCLFCSLFYNIWLSKNNEYLPYLHYTSRDLGFFDDLFSRLGNWLLIFTNFVPISLLVTLEVVRLCQANMMMYDDKMKTDDISAIVQSSNLNEELGQVQFVFSDKTGTLTVNQMVFKKLSVDGVIYGSHRDHQRPPEWADQFPEVDFADKLFFDTLQNPVLKASHSISDMLLAMAITHTVIVESQQGRSVYSASSPDEMALVSFAKMCDFEFIGTDENNIMTIKLQNQIKTYQLLHVLEFNSARKRMSIILRDENNDVYLYTKGADSIVLSRTKKMQNKLDPTHDILQAFGNDGLRTLVYARKKLTSEEYSEWAGRYHEACTSMENREEKMEVLQDEIEKNLDFLGTTGIEDKLQDQVAETIDFILQAGIKFWVLTGDKVETARSIGRSCHLIKTMMTELKIEGHTEELVQEELLKHTEKVAKYPKYDYYMIITGDALHVIDNPVALKMFNDLSLKVKTVLACRVSPKQKQEVVELVRRNTNCISLSIGDGANDVNMINAANVGVGIKGKEGLQAARASDFSIGEFKHLKRLMFYHGREAYRRNTHVIRYNFFKNMVLVLPQFWYGFLNVFSGQILYDAFLIQFYNLIYAGLPIVIYAVFDQEYSDEEFEREPLHYVLGKENKVFRTTSFWSWVISGALQGIPIAYFSFYIMENTALNDTGIMADFWVAGMMTFTLTVFITNFKMLLFSFSFNIMAIVSVFGSMIVYYYSFWIPNRFMRTSEMYHLLYISQSSAYYYLAIIIIIVSTTMFDCAIERYINIRRREKIHAMKIYRDSVLLHDYNSHLHKSMIVTHSTIASSEFSIN